MSDRQEARDEPARLERVVPIAHELRDGTWIVSVDLWEDHLVLTWAKPSPRHWRYIDEVDDFAPPEMPFTYEDQLDAPDWQISDDVGTAFSVGRATASSSDGGARGEIEFVGTVPYTATVLTVSRGMSGEQVTVSLAD